MEVVLEVVVEQHYCCGILSSRLLFLSRTISFIVVETETVIAVIGITQSCTVLLLMPKKPSKCE